MHKPILLLLVTALLYIPAFSQENDANKEKSYGQFSLNYLSNSVYLGRKDSLRAPYITPALGYYDKSGFFVTGALSYLNTSGSRRIDLFTLGAGFEKEFTSKITAGAYAEKYFYNNSSYNVQAEIKAMLGLYGTYNFGPVELGGNVNLAAGKYSDWIAGAELKHTFYAAGEKLEITPAVSLNAASQIFYKSYYQNRPVIRRRNGVVVPVQPVANLENATQFRLLDYELSTEIKYSTGRWEFTLTPTVFFPVNPAIITIGPKKITETLDNPVTMELEVGWRF
jgi:hypothetical protein